MKKLLFCVLLLAASCRDERPPGPSEDQSAKLNEMDAELNAMAANEEGPADHSASPSNNSSK